MFQIKNEKKTQHIDKFVNYFNSVFIMDVTNRCLAGVQDYYNYYMADSKIPGETLVFSK